MTTSRVEWVSVKDLPPRDYKEVGYVSIDIRKVAKRHGVELELKENDRGQYLVAGAIVDGVPMKIVGLVPFVERETAIVADLSEAEVARNCAESIFGQGVEVYFN